jgi:hypothetical protein
MLNVVYALVKQLGSYTECHLCLLSLWQMPLYRVSFMLSIAINPIRLSVIKLKAVGLSVTIKPIMLNIVMLRVVYA